LSAGMARNWLGRSGQAWTMIGYSIRTWLGLGLMMIGFVAHWHGVAVGGLLALVADRVLLMLIRCSVCGLRLFTSTAARAVGMSEREDWLLALESCPVCGDDGRATRDSRALWRASGRLPEVPYWSGGRLAAAILATLILVGGGVALGVLYRIRP
jgi:hypothetical protein